MWRYNKDAPNANKHCGVMSLSMKKISEALSKRVFAAQIGMIFLVGEINETKNFSRAI